MKANNEVQAIQKNQIQQIIDNNQLKELFLSKMDDNEVQGKNRFEDFNDLALIAHFLTADKHLVVERNRTQQTMDIYSKVLMAFYNHVVIYEKEIEIDIQEPVLLSNGEYSLLRSLQPRHIRRYVDWFQNKSPHVMQRNKPYKLSSLAQKLTIIKSFLKALYTWEVISKPIHLEIKSTSVTAEDRPNRDAGTAHVLLLLKTFEKHKNVTMFAIIHFLTTTGIRNQEMCNLKVGNIQYDKINNQYTMRIIAKGNKQRIIPLLDKTLRSVNLFRHARGFEKIDATTLNRLNPNEPVFATNRGSAYSPSYLIQYIHRQIENLQDEDAATVKEMFSYREHERPHDKNSPIVQKEMVITPHLFRHAFAIISSKINKIDVYSISRSLGHSSITTTQIYLEKVFEAEGNVIHQWDASALGDYI